MLDRDHQRYLAEQLHHAARRYCIDWYEHWCEVYQKPPHKGGAPYSYSDREYTIFPRYNLLNAIRVEVERLDPAAIDSLAIMRQRLASVGDTADDPFTRKDTNAIEAAAQAEERAKFVSFVSSLNEADLMSVEALPYRRTLRDDEIPRLLDRLRASWGAAFPWYPLTGHKPPSCEVFQARPFGDEIDVRTLRKLIKGLAVGHVWEVREGPPSFEVDLEACDPFYNGAEAFWFTNTLDWVIYASHESSITVAGGALLAALKKAWPGWHRRIWTTPFYR